VLFLSLASFACSRSEAPAPVATSTPKASTSTAAPVAAASGVPAAAASAAPPSAGASPGVVNTDLNDFSDVADFDWELADEAEGTDFEIDAGATSFYMPRGNIVAFKAKALNGTPPFTFTWDFGDGSPQASGEMVKHAFNKLGTLEVTARGADASGATAFMQLQILIVHPVDFAIRAQEDEKSIEELKKRFPDWVPHTPVPAVSPAS
jgi:hypothetical protein